ncbi:MAG: PIN domain-containing protein, partial [Chlorobium sp.]
GYRSYNNFISFLHQNNYTDFDESILSFNPSSIGAELSNSRILAIEQILDSDVAIQVPVSGWSKNMAIEHALKKKAPFRSRNSMADALIFFSAVEWVDTKKPDNSFFVTHNTKDFSEPQMPNNELLAVDLQPFVANINLGYDIIIGRFFNKIEQFVVTKEEIEQEETDVELIRFQEELSEDSIFGSRISKFFEEQRNRDKSLSGVVSKAFEQQKKWQEMLSGGAVNKMFEEQRALQDSIAGAMGKILEEQRKLQETLLGGGVSKLIEEQQKMQDPLSGGVMSKVLEEQQKLQENLTGCGVSKLIEEHRKIQERLSGGIVNKLLDSNNFDGLY